MKLVPLSAESRPKPLWSKGAAAEGLWQTRTRETLAEPATGGLTHF